MGDSEKPTSGGQMKTGLWISLFSSALQGLCANPDVEVGPSEIAKDAASVADAATLLVLDRMEIAVAGQKVHEPQE